jgi:PLP dependent protein
MRPGDAGVVVISSAQELGPRVGAVLELIANAARRAGRDPSDVTLIAVTKTLPPQVVAWGAQAGLGDFGENYVKELAEKRGSAPDARWHFIGPLQSHTAQRLVPIADVVHSAVPGHALERLAARAVRERRTVPVLLQVDETSSHAGVPPDEADTALTTIGDLEGVEAIGLMTLPPQPTDPEDSRPYFARLRTLRDDLRERVPGLRELSMGMSLDYEIAVEEGATMVRVGTALFGSRPSPEPGPDRDR